MPSKYLAKVGSRQVSNPPAIFRELLHAPSEAEIDKMEAAFRAAEVEASILAMSHQVTDSVAAWIEDLERNTDRCWFDEGFLHLPRGLSLRDVLLNDPDPFGDLMCSGGGPWGPNDLEIQVLEMQLRPHMDEGMRQLYETELAWLSHCPESEVTEEVFALIYLDAEIVKIENSRMYAF